MKNDGLVMIISKFLFPGAGTRFSETNCHMLEGMRRVQTKLFYKSTSGHGVNSWQCNMIATRKYIYIFLYLVYVCLTQIIDTGAISTQKQLDFLLRERMNQIILWLQLPVKMLLYGRNVPVSVDGKVTKTGNIAESENKTFYLNAANK